MSGAPTSSSRRITSHTDNGTPTAAEKHWKRREWTPKNAPNGESWEPSGGIVLFLGRVLQECAVSNMYNITQQRWNLGSDLKGSGLAGSFRRLLEHLLRLWDSQGMFVASQRLRSVKTLDTVNKSLPLLALSRRSGGASGAAAPEPIYDCCEFPVEIREMDKFGPDLESQLAVYAHHCMAERPERRSVCCLVLTEITLFIYVFDHAGYYMAHSVKIHQSPTRFIYTIFCLSRPSQDTGERVGTDPALFAEGRNISTFKDKMELLYILRDAIQEHWSLWKKGICHRDIRPETIKIIESHDGTRAKGKLVVLEMAKQSGNITAVVPSMPGSMNGFQSIMVLRMADMGTPPSAFPDCFDDLESFFYVLLRLCSTDPRGAHSLNETQQNQLASLFEQWDSPVPRISWLPKLAFWQRPIIEVFVQPHFGAVFAQLLEGMLRALVRYNTERAKSSQIFKGRFGPPQYCASEGGYTGFLALIDHAIEQENRRFLTG